MTALLRNEIIKAPPLLYVYAERSTLGRSCSFCVGVGDEVMNTE